MYLTIRHSFLVRPNPARIEEVCKFGLAAEGCSGMPLYRTVPRSNDICWSSFECQGGSLENNRRAENAAMIKDAETTNTAITFHGTVQFQALSTTKLGVSENSSGLVKHFAGVNQVVDADFDSVTESFGTEAGSDVEVESEDDGHNSDGHGRKFVNSIATSTKCGDAEPKVLAIPASLNANMAQIYKVFHENFCVVTHLILNNKDFLIPVKRARVWLLWVNYLNLNIDPEVTLERLHRAQMKIYQMRDVLKDKRLPMDAITLKPADHPILLAELDRRQAKLVQKEKASRKSAAGGGIRKPSLYASMKNTYDAYLVEWVEPAHGSHAKHHVGTQLLDPYRERTNVWYKALASREKYILNLIEKVHPRQGEEKRAFVLSRSVERCARDRPVPSLWPCTMPRTKV